MTLETERPAPGPTGCGSFQSVHFAGERAKDTGKIEFRIEPDGAPIVVSGRVAQTLLLLIETGGRGFTSGEASPYRWARRTSHYVFVLRSLGVHIDTLRELAGDVRIGRYILRSRVTLVTVAEASPQVA